MSVKNKVYQFGKMIKDPSRAKAPEGTYYHAHNIRFVSTSNEILGGFHFEKGNQLKLQFPKPIITPSSNSISYVVKRFDDNEVPTATETYEIPYRVESPVFEGSPRNEIEREYINIDNTIKQSGDQLPLGYCITTKGICIITTDNMGFDCVWLLSFENDKFNIMLKYMRNMGLSNNHPIEMLNNYENEKIDKIYWIDTIHQLRHLNLEQSIKNGDYDELIDMNIDLIEAISSSDMSQPIITEINFGGTHTAGMIQYAYILYKMNGSQTMLSPASELVPLGKGFTEGGGDINEMVGTSPTIRISNIDLKYDNIVVYGIKYNSYNGLPEVLVIEDRSIPENGVIEIYDNGTSIGTSSIEELKLINNSLNFPGSIASKDNSLFLANFKENNFKLNLDTRAYQFPLNTLPNVSLLTPVYDNIYTESNGNITGNIRNIISNQSDLAYTDDPDDTFDSINLNYDVLAYRPHTNKRGGEGKYLFFEIVNANKIDPTHRYLKDNEIYRISIHFYNAFGQTSLPRWICDFKAPQMNLKGRPNMLKVGLKPEFYNWVAASNLDIYNKPVGYKILVAERTNADKTILSSGVINPMMISNTTAISGIYHETFDNGHQVRVIHSRLNDLNNILKHKIKTPNPGFRNYWLDESKTDHEVLYNGGATGTNQFHMPPYNTLVTRLIDSPLQKASHYRNLDSALVEGCDSLIPRYLTEFPSSKDKPNRYWNYQDSKTMQMYSPEALFNTTPVLPEDCTLEVRCAFRNSENGNWLRVIDTSGGAILIEWKIKNRLSTQINVDLSSNVNPVEWVMPGNQGTYNDMVNQAQPTNKEQLCNLLYYPSGWARSGMYSNFWADKIGGTESFTTVQLFYRRYGDKVENITGLIEVTQYNPNIPIPITPPQLVGMNITSNDQGLNYTISESLVEEYNGATNVLISNTLTILNTSATKFGNVTLTTINNGNADTATLELDGSSGNTVTLNSIIPVQDGMTPSVFVTGVQLSNLDQTVEVIEGDLNFETSITVLDELDNDIAGYTTSNILNYSLLPQHGSTPINNVFSPNIVQTGGTGTATTSYPIYGRPVFTKRAQSVKEYNGDGYFKFANTLGMVGSNDLGGNDNEVDKTIRGINADAANCITFVLNPDASENNLDAVSYEDVIKNGKFKSSNFRHNVGTVYADIVRSRKDIYFGGIYGGNSFEDKKRTNYLEVGEYKRIEDNEVIITSPGDTYIQNFKLLRISRGNINEITPANIEFEEILEYPTETTIDLLNRNDKSFMQWDGDFSYGDAEYHKYNRVYSQQNKLSSTRDLEYNFKPVNYYNATIRGSKKKINGEYIDSWLQPMINEALDLDGKYGPITKLITFKDNMYSTQERAVSVISINPKIQLTEPNSGTLQLGTGQLLDSYTYLTTGKGSMKWSSIATEEAIYFVDPLSKTINSFSAKGIQDLSLEGGIKQWSIENIVDDYFDDDNPLLANGISLGYDLTRGDVYFTFAKQDLGETFTLVYNSVQSGFAGFYDYNSPMYINYKGEMFTFKPQSNSNIYQSFRGKYNNFYGQNKPSWIEFIVQPEPHVECTFNNLEYKDEASDQNGEVNKTFETIRVDNEFQDSEVINLVPKFNIRKLNRKWRLNIPRHRNKISRIRNNWAKICLYSNNLEAYNHKIDDVILYYVPNYKIIK